MKYELASGIVSYLAITIPIILTIIAFAIYELALQLRLIRERFDTLLVTLAELLVKLNAILTRRDQDK